MTTPDDIDDRLCAELRAEVHDNHPRLDEAVHPRDGAPGQSLQAPDRVLKFIVDRPDLASEAGLRGAFGLGRRRVREILADLEADGSVVRWTDTRFGEPIQRWRSTSIRVPEAITRALKQLAASVTGTPAADGCAAALVWIDGLPGGES